MVEVTPQASEAIKAIMAEKNLEGTLRIFLQQGCGGAQLALGIDELRPTDDSYETDGVTYVVDKELSVITGKLTLDYMDEAAQTGFRISSENPLPAPEGGCGCGCSC